MMVLGNPLKILVDSILWKSNLQNVSAFWTWTFERGFGTKKNRSLSCNCKRKLCFYRIFCILSFCFFCLSVSYSFFCLLFFNLCFSLCRVVLEPRKIAHLAVIVTVSCVFLIFKIFFLNSLSFCLSLCIILFDSVSCIFISVSIFVEWFWNQENLLV